MKLNFRFLLGLFFSILFASCEKNDDPTPPIEGSRTVLVYIVADKNGLDENYNGQDFATQDVEEMLEGMKSVDTSLYNLLVYLDNNDKPVLFRINGDAQGNVSKEILKEYDEQVSTDTSVMTEVLKRAFNEYPADSYGLVYWSHCNGWIPYPLRTPQTRWVGQDKGDGNDNRMNVSALLTVLDSAPRLEFIMFDACFMLSVEVAYELRNYAKYYIGSPTENPGSGAPYDKVVPQMFTQNAAVNMATEYFKVYERDYNGGVNMTNLNWTGGTSITVLKSSELENLAATTKQVLPEGTKISELRSNVFDYDKRTGEGTDGHVGYYDMQEMMQYLLNDDSAAFDQWIQSFDASVAYWNTTEKNYSMFAGYKFDNVMGMFPMKPHAHGVTHYIPSASTASAAQAADAAYRSTLWYSAAGLSELGW